MTRLLIGSEGTLGIVTEATLKLHGIPKVRYLLFITVSIHRSACLPVGKPRSTGLQIITQHTHTHIFMHTHIYARRNLSS